MATSLQGGCACSRNKYIITIPPSANASEYAQITFNNSSHSRRLQASPMTAFLKIPLPWFQSTTIAYRPDETHQTIRRTFSVPHRDHLRHQFCGYCGTQLILLDDSSREEDAFVSVTVGSLADEDLDTLKDLGLLDDNQGDEQMGGTAGSGTEDVMIRKVGGVEHRGAPWFEELIQDSALGRIRTRRGGRTSGDGSVVSTWEVVEWNSAEQDDDSTGGVTGKRKIEQLEGSPEAEMND